jgi:hypothetical protein
MLKETRISEEELIMIENALVQVREYLRSDAGSNAAKLKDNLTKAEQIVSNKLSNDLSNQTWEILSKVGFVQHYKKLIEDLLRVHEDRLKQFFQEREKPDEHQDGKLISMINFDIRENARLLFDLGLLTPTGTNIKKRILESYQRMRTKENIDPDTGDIQR